MWIVYHGSYKAVEVPAARRVVGSEPVEVPDHIGAALVSQGDFSEVKHAQEPEPPKPKSRRGSKKAEEDPEPVDDALTDEDGEE